MLEAVRVQAEEHPLIDDKAPETLSEKCLHLMHLKAYAEAREHTAGRDVLDVGCNTGYGTVRLVGDARSVTGVDVSPAAVEAARTRPGGEGVVFQVIDGFGLPFPDASFDLVTSFQVIEHVADPGPYLHEIRRVLRPGGRALFTTPNAATRLDPGMTPWNRFHVREYRAAELQHVLGDVFDDVEVLGMFGVPTLYDLEITRVDGNRKLVRKRAAEEAERLRREEDEARQEAERAAAAAAPAPPPPPAPGLLRKVRRRLGRTPAGMFVRRGLGRLPAPAAPRPAAAAQPVRPPAGAASTTEAAAAPPPPAPVDFDAYEVSDLFYSGRDLDRAMDLLAVCEVAER
jgi:SAM-dependent methyltransferase